MVCINALLLLAEQHFNIVKGISMTCARLAEGACAYTVNAQDYVCMLNHFMYDNLMNMTYTCWEPIFSLS